MSDEPLDSVEINPDIPPAFTVIWLHGLGADGHDFEALVPELNLPAGLPVRFVFPHAPRRSITINMGTVMRGWYDIAAPDLSRQVDHAGIEESVDHVRRLIHKEIVSGTPSDRILLAGFSQGGVIVLHAGLRHEKKLAGILALSTYCPTLDALEPDKSVANRQTPIMMAHGQYDPLIPMALAENAREGLLHLGYGVHWRQYPMQHEMCLEEIQDIRVWLLQVMASSAL